MKTHLIYASAIVLSALILGYFYALAHHYQRVPLYEVGNETTYGTLNTWSGVDVKYVRPGK